MDGRLEPFFNEFWGRHVETLRLGSASCSRQVASSEECDANRACSVSRIAWQRLPLGRRGLEGWSPLLSLSALLDLVHAMQTASCRYKSYKPKNKQTTLINFIELPLKPPVDELCLFLSLSPTYLQILSST